MGTWKFHLLISALYLTSILAGSSSPPPTKTSGARIFRGFKTREGDMPFIGGLAFNVSSPAKVSDMYCTAFLIARQWALTAGHCHKPDRGPTYFLIRAPPEKPSIIVIPVRNWTLHPEFRLTSERRGHADIALLYLENGYSVSPVKIANKKTDPIDTFKTLGYRGIALCVAGYGNIGKNRTKPTTLYKTYTYLKQCYAGWNVDLDRAICYVTGPSGEGPCPGDSGSPVMFETADSQLAIGIASSGPSGCTDPVRPWGNLGMGVRISGFFNWIKKTMCAQDGSKLPYTNYKC